MKTRLLILITFFVFTLGSVGIVYGLDESITPDINNINENSSQRLMTITLTNTTGIVEEDVSYNRTCPEDTDWPDAPNRCDR